MRWVSLRRWSRRGQCHQGRAVLAARRTQLRAVLSSAPDGLDDERTVVDALIRQIRALDGRRRLEGDGDVVAVARGELMLHVATLSFEQVLVETAGDRSAERNMGLGAEASMGDCMGGFRVSHRNHLRSCSGER